MSTNSQPPDVGTFRGFPPTYTTRCPECRYDLRGLPATHRCPECEFEYDAATIVWRPSRKKFAIHMLLGIAVTLIFAFVFFDDATSRTPMTIDDYTRRFPIFGVPFVVGFLLVKRGSVRYIVVTSNAMILRKAFRKSTPIEFDRIERFERTGKGHTSPMRHPSDQRPNKSTVYDREMFDVILYDPTNQSTKSATYILLGAGDKTLRRFVHLANRNVNRYKQRVRS